MIIVRIGQLADQLGVHRNTVRNWINSGKLPARSMSGKRYLISEADFSKLCREFGLDRSAMKLKYVPGQLIMSRELSVMEENVRALDERSQRLRPTPQWGDVCLTCGSCASACPISGVDGVDPRKVVRMAVLGLEEELINSSWPWKCTLCGKCEEACPMQVEIVSLIHRARSLRDAEKIPGALRRGVALSLERGNNMGIPTEDFVELMEEMSREMDGSSTGFDSRLDVQGANIMVTVNSKIPFAESHLLKHWWKIFQAAGESWTIPSRNWEGVNWGYFTGDESAMRTMVERIVENMHRLGCRTLLLPE